MWPLTNVSQALNRSFVVNFYIDGLKLKSSPYDTDLGCIWIGSLCAEFENM